MAIDPETVLSLPIYRVGLQPPSDGSLAAGELYVEVAPVPRLWVGTIAGAGFEGDVALLCATAPLAAPVCRNTPYVSQTDVTLNCTMGEWTGEPDSYVYEWQLDGAPVGPGDGAGNLTVTADDDGKSATCVVSATNDTGTTDAPPSNAVVITAPPADAA